MATLGQMEEDRKKAYLASQQPQTPTSTAGAVTGEDYGDFRGMLSGHTKYLQDVAQTGMAPQERIGMRQQYLQPAQEMLQNQQRMLAGQQARSGVRGGAAFAQGDAMRQQFGQALAGGERDIMMADHARRQAAQQQLGSIGSRERAAYLGEALAQRASEERMAGQESMRSFLDQMLEMKRKKLEEDQAPPPPVAPPAPTGISPAQSAGVSSGWGANHNQPIKKA